MQVKVLFFGVLSEVAGTDCRHYNDVRSIDDLKLRYWMNFLKLNITITGFHLIMRSLTATGF